MVVKSRKALNEGPVAESERYAIALSAVRALDRAAAKGILHPNNVARRKSRLARQMARLAIATPAPTGKGKKAAASSAPSRGAAQPKAPAQAKKK